MGTKTQNVTTESPQAAGKPAHRWIAICQGTGCSSAGSAQIHKTLAEELARHGLQNQIEVRRTGCFGFCSQGPIFVVHPEQTFYTHVKPADVPEIVTEHLINGRRIERLLYLDPSQNAPIEHWYDIGFYSKQKRILLANCGISIRKKSTIIGEGYIALRQVWEDDPEDG
jgi:(2Fe-2S) ferredoxin